MAGLINTNAVDPESATAGFSRRIFVGSSVLTKATLSRIEAEVDRYSRTERSYLPTHKKGGAIAYETLRAKIPSVADLYLSPEMSSLISRITGVPVVPTPFSDKSSCSVLVYEEPGDHIGWHYDHNFYKGRHFTVLIPIVNRGSGPDGLSAARLLVKSGQREEAVATPPNALVVFEGAKVRHKVMPIETGERRVVLSMTYCTDPRNSVVQESMRRIKDTAFFGLRALWS